MAILRAISGGNYWNSGSKWEVYDPQTNTWSAYNCAPQDGDYCYLNGYTLKISNLVEINIGNGTIDNVGNAEIGVSAGGAIDIEAFATRNVTANLVIGDQQMYRFASASGYIWTFIGNITIVGTASFGGGAISGNNSIIIIGNVTFKNASLINLNTVISSLTITGNVTAEGGKLYNVATPVTINGNVTDLMLNSTSTINGSYTLAQYNSDSNITATINGDINLFNGHYLSCTTLNFYGDSIKYSGWATDSIGNLKVKNLNIGNLTNFTWHDVSVVRTAPFFIVTDYDLNNTQQYPAPANVKKDIPYAWGELVGQYLPDYPIPQNVLKDVSYDSGSLIGTLEIPQVPTTSDIVNAIKNDSDLGGKINTTNTNVGNISTAVTTIDGKVDIIDTNVDTLVSRLTSVLTQRLGQSVTVEILQQILVAHLDN